MDYLQQVKDSAQKLGLLDPEGKLGKMDSMAIIDLVVELEISCKIKIPASNLSQEHFATIESVASFLNKLADGSPVS